MVTLVTRSTTMNLPSLSARMPETLVTVVALPSCGSNNISRPTTAVRAITCLPAIVGSWREVGGGALLSTSKLYPFDTNALERPDLIPPGTRTINMTQLAEALLGELPGPPVRAMYVYNSNPAAVCPDQSRVLKGMRREGLFTVVH